MLRREHLLPRIVVRSVGSLPWNSSKSGFDNYPRVPRVLPDLKLPCSAFLPYPWEKLKWKSRGHRKPTLQTWARQRCLDATCRNSEKWRLSTTRNGWNTHLQLSKQQQPFHPNVGAFLRRSFPVSSSSSQVPNPVLICAIQWSVFMLLNEQKRIRGRPPISRVLIPTSPVKWSKLTPHKQGDNLLSSCLKEEETGFRTGGKSSVGGKFD